MLVSLPISEVHQFLWGVMLRFNGFHVRFGNNVYINPPSRTRYESKDFSQHLQKGEKSIWVQDMFWVDFTGLWLTNMDVNWMLTAQRKSEKHGWIYFPLYSLFIRAAAPGLSMTVFFSLSHLTIEPVLYEIIASCTVAVDWNASQGWQSIIFWSLFLTAEIKPARCRSCISGVATANSSLGSSFPLPNTITLESSAKMTPYRRKKDTVIVFPVLITVTTETMLPTYRSTLEADFTLRVSVSLWSFSTRIPPRRITLFERWSE